MKIKSSILVIMLLLAVMPGMVMAQSTIMEELGSKAAQIAMQELKVEKGDASVLVLTSAGHAIVDGQTTQAAITGLATESGNSIGDANLFQVLRPYWKPVWFFFFDKATGEAVFMQRKASH